MISRILYRTTPCFFLAISGFTAEIVKNPSFDNPINAWSVEGSQYTTQFQTDPEKFIEFNISNGGTEYWDAALYQGNLNIKKGYKYQIDWQASRDSSLLILELSDISTGTLYLDTIISNGNFISHSQVYQHCSDDLTNAKLSINIGGSNTAVKMKSVSITESDAASNCETPLLQYSKTCEMVADEDSIGIHNGEGPVSYYGKLKTCGSQIIGSRTKAPAQVKGMSLFWSQWASEFYTRAAVTTLAKEWNGEIIRAAMAVEKGGGYIGNPNEQLNLVDSIVKSSIDNDIYVIIDFHSHEADLHQEKAIEFFTHMAKKWGHYDNVIFELFNEPLNVSWESVKSYAEKVTTAIRKHSDNLIIVGTPTWSQDVDFVIGNQINDKNIAYTLHFYAGSHSTGLRIKAKTALDAGIPIMATEWGTVNADGAGRVRSASSDNWMKFLDENKISWANWSLNNKAEGASALTYNAMLDASNWTPEKSLTESGIYVYNQLQAHYNSPDSYRRINHPLPIFNSFKTKSRDFDLEIDKQNISYSRWSTNSQNAYLFNSQGKVLYSYTIEAGSVNPNLKHYLNKGIYTLMIEVDDQISSQNFIVK